MTDPELPPGTGKRRAALAFILVTVLLDSIGLGIIIPVTPELIMELTGEGLSRATVYGGWLLFAFAVMQFIFSPILGNLSDRFGRRPVLLASLLAYALDYFLMGLAPTLAWLFVGRMIAGVAGATYGTASAYIADVTPAENRAAKFGLIGAAFGVGFIIGPVVGGLLGEFGPRVPFFAAGVVALINAAYGLFVLPESLAPEDRRPFTLSRSNPFGALRQMKKYPAVLSLIAVSFLWQMSHYVNPATWSYFTLEKFDWSEAQVGYSLGFVGLLMVLVQGFLTGRVIPRLGEVRCAVIGMSFAALAFIGYAFATEGWMLYAWMIPGALGGFTFPSIQSLLSKQIPANAQGELQGALGAVSSLVSILAPPILTQLFGFYTAPENPVYFPGAAFVAAALLAFAAIAVFLLVARRRLGATAAG